MDRNFQPDLQNLDSYKRELAWCIKEGKSLREVPSIPSCPFRDGWSKEERKAMVTNRMKAKKLYSDAVQKTK